MDTIKIAVEKIRQHIPNVVGIYLFGSFASEQATLQSDVDIAIFSETFLDQTTLWNTSQIIAAAINRDVDLIDLNSASTVFAYQVISSGKRIFCAAPHTCDNFENKVISMYLRFQEERKPILEEIVKRGKVL